MLFNPFKTKYYKFIILLFMWQAIEADPLVDNGNGTISDNGTGLVWQKCNVGSSGNNCTTGTATKMYWATALTTCNSLTLANKTWRLPSINELRSIIDRTKKPYTIDTTFFPVTTETNSLWWSSTTVMSSTKDYVWHVSFHFGFVGSSNSSKSFDQLYVRCVSTGP